MVQYNQSLFENMWMNRQNVVFHEFHEFSNEASNFWVSPEPDCWKQKKVTQKSEKQLPLKNHLL